MNKNFVIIHYNTPYLTECLVRSINLYVDNALIYIFDNSDKLPFTAQFENVKIIDNTNGDIINFDRWLENYPNRKKSGGRSNNWGSAKHCYSVEKCMEIIDDNFILLDSDVLLKRDISDLFNDDFIFIGEVILQPKSVIKRLLPFMCFINVKMCKENGIHYFDDNYMHGLRKKGKSDNYDTGAGFYLSSEKYNHKIIKLDDYIVHYGHGSWNKKGCEKILTQNEWALLNKKYWNMEKNKKVIYTCIIGEYDQLIEPTKISDGFDYICFTDNDYFESEIWDIRPLPEDILYLPQVKQQRCIKINPHKYLKEYDISIWVDGNVAIRGDLNELLDKTIEDGISIYVPQHPNRHCIYEESRIVMAMRKDDNDTVIGQMKRYESEGFPAFYGLLQSNILIRKHNEKDCIKLMEEWFDEVKNGSKRDQLSFNYVSWKNKDITVKYLDRKIYESEWFKWKGSHPKPKRKEVVKPKVIEVQTKKKDIEELKEKFRNIVSQKRKLMTSEVNIYNV